MYIHAHVNRTRQNLIWTMIWLVDAAIMVVLLLVLVWQLVKYTYMYISSLGNNAKDNKITVDCTDEYKVYM